MQVVAMRSSAADVPAFQRFQRAAWDRAAESYHRVWRPMTSQFSDPLLDAAEIGTGQHVLDLACGPGYVAAAAAARGASVVGVDLSPGMVALAGTMHPGIEVRQAAAEALPFADGTFDRVLMSFGVNHVAAPEVVFREAARVLRAGGRLAFTVWAGGTHNALAALLEAAIGAHAVPAPDLPVGPDIYLYADPGRCREMLPPLGFVADSVQATLHAGAWEVATPREVFEAERHHGVRTSALLARQDAERLERIRIAIEAGVAAHPAGEGFAVPIAAWVVRADRQPSPG
jgi:SAM-dependent methyltransferase